MTSAVILLAWLLLLADGGLGSRPAAAPWASPAPAPLGGLPRALLQKKREVEQRHVKQTELVMGW
jgi:hypothetical protein